MTNPTGPYAVDMTDFKWSAFGVDWCLSIEYEDMDNGYTPVLWTRDAGQWRYVADWHGGGNYGPAGGHVLSSDEIKARFGSPWLYLRAVCDWAVTQMRLQMTVPLPVPGDALSRSLYHAKKSISWDGENLELPPNGLEP